MGAIRLFLALVVVFDHIRTVALKPRSTDVDVVLALGFNAGFAVMFFYVISGFLISYVLNRKYGASTSGATAFYASRFVRIFALYWPLAVVVLLASPNAWPTFVAGGITDKLTNVFLLGIDWNTAFGNYPLQNPGAAISELWQAWTLGAE